MGCSIRVMNIFIDNVSAMKFYCRVKSSLDEESAPCYFTNAQNSTAAEKAVNRIANECEVDLDSLRTKSGALHVLVDSCSKKWNSKSVECHRTSHPVPRGSFRKIAESVYIVSPEYCFMEMASVLPFAKLVEFGYVLCGTYTLNPEADEKNRRKPLASVQGIESFISKLPRKKGRVAALRALMYVREGSASPRETKNTLLLCLPVRIGGYGYPMPILNHTFNFSPEEQLAFGVPYAILDLWWPDYHFGIEYDGGEGHTEVADIARDRKKSSNLQYLGVMVMRVDKEQLSSPSEVYALAKKAARIMGIRFRKPTPEQWRLKCELFDVLM